MENAVDLRAAPTLTEEGGSCWLSSEFSLSALIFIPPHSHWLQKYTDTGTLKQLLAVRFG